MPLKRLILAAAIAAAGLTFAATSASAATISCANGCSTIFYKADPGETNTPVFSNAHSGATCRPGTCFFNGQDAGYLAFPGYYGELIVDPSATLVGKAGCVNDSPHQVWCHSTFNQPGTVNLSLNDGNDSYTDSSDAGWGITGTAGSGDDTIVHTVPAAFVGSVNLDLGGGSDTITSSGGAQSIIGGSGVDLISLSDFTSVNVTGDGSGDRITLSAARAGGAGPYSVDGGIGKDTINTVDGVSDTVACGDDRDTFTVDAIDVVGADCP